MYAVTNEQSDAPPEVWPALADPTRRLLIDRLAEGPKTTSQLCENMPMSRFGVMKHLAVLERAGLVIARRHGRIRMNHLNVAPLRALQDRWLSARAVQISASVDRFTSSFGDPPMTLDASQTSVVDVALDWQIAASVQQVWAALFERPEAWWPTAHRAGPEGSRMVFDARVGGSLREERADGGGLIWYTILALDPLRAVDLSGQLATRYGGPATSLLHLEITPGASDGTTVLKLTDSVFGRVGPDMRASLTSGWQAIVGEGLVRHIEGGQ
jgi:DNA-binding transcriptional ArsR family regulator